MFCHSCLDDSHEFVCSEKKEEEKIDFQVPRKRSMAPAPPVIRDPAAMAPEPRVEFKFKQKAMPSLGNSSGNMIDSVLVMKLIDGSVDRR